MRDKPEAGGRRRERAPALSACSACAGDYEDPDRMAGASQEDIDAEDLGVCEEIDEEGFPAEK